MKKVKAIETWMNKNNIEHKIGSDFFEVNTVCYVNLYRPSLDKWGRETMSIDWQLADKIQRYAKRIHIKTEFRASYNAIALVIET